MTRGIVSYPIFDERAAATGSLFSPSGGIFLSPFVLSGFSLWWGWEETLVFCPLDTVWQLE